MWGGGGTGSGPVPSGSVKSGRDGSGRVRVRPAVRREERHAMIAAPDLPTGDSDTPTRHAARDKNGRQ